MIIVTKIRITVIMKTTIVLKLMKVVVQSYNLKTYICPNTGNAQHEVYKKLHTAQHCRNKCKAARVPKAETFKHFLQY